MVTWPLYWTASPRPILFSNSVSQITELNCPNNNTHNFITWGNPVRTKWSVGWTAHSCKPHLVYGVLPPQYNDHELTTMALSGYHLILNTVHRQRGQSVLLHTQPRGTRFASLCTLPSMALYYTILCYTLWTTGLTWVHVSSYGERDFVINNRHCVYFIVNL